MVEPASTLTAAVLIDLAFRKLVELGAGELGKKFTEAALKRMDDLRQAIVARLRGRSEKVDEALAKLEQGDKSGSETVVKNLDVVMDEYPEFANELKAIAQEINAGKLQDNSSMVMNVSDHATGYQTKNEVTNHAGENYTGAITINKYHTPQPAPLPKPEADLLQQINLGLSSDRWEHYHTLLAKRRTETLTPAEHATLIDISDQIEQANVQRIQALIELAKLRGQSLSIVMQELGIEGGGRRSCVTPSAISPHLHAIAPIYGACQIRS